jgi:pyruvate dehydrogenase E2 component (dihydrolipoamide acetyltransferase)
MSEIIMPKMGDAMTEGKVVRWYKKAGDAIKKGEPVLEIETDKVNLDLEAESDGTLSDVSATDGQVVQVGGRLALILAEGEKAPEPEQVAAPPAAEKKAAAKAPAATSTAAAPVAEEGAHTRRRTDQKDSFKHSTGEYGEAMEMKGPRIDRSSAQTHGGETAAAAESQDESARRRSSPLARKMARELGVKIESLQGSGPGGRIIADDVRGANAGGAQQQSPATAATPAAQSQQPSKPQPPQISALAPQLENKQVPLTAMRRTIAKRLGESTGPIPHFYLTIDLDVTDLLALRKQINEIQGVRISVNDFIVKGVALALRHHPNVNASWGDDAISLHGEVHIGIAVSTADGLITPVIRNADAKSVSSIAEEVRLLADKAKNRKLLPNEYQGSTFTISNLGAWGIDEFTAIINPPNVAILAIGTATQQPVVRDGQIVIRDRMKVTMSCDHRVIDGALGAEYLKTLRAYLEQPMRMFV